ncbi:TonB-dependent receptor [Reichenbachiella versicolor]|uniref:TonB-dependent receptor n=1 Tax=Reichenbachiella versicolor TaxID=1821036 RepID=UPI001C86C990|nr:TonB-dependent receptor [Reichenbachiella versicolor]
MMRLKVYSTLFFLVFTLGLRAEEALNTISGLVVDGTTQQPISDAQIFVQEISGIYTTDSKGRFEINNLKDGFYTLTIFAFQYETLKERITIDTDVSLSFQLEQLVTELSEVVINQKKEEVFKLKRLNPVEGTAIYAGKKTEVVLLDNMIGNMAINNARQVYAQIAGLNIYESNDGGLQLSIGGRGLDPNRTSNFNTRQNGYDISADVLGYPESYYTPPVEGLEEIEVIRGAASLQYGTQFGGLINFKMKEPVKNKKVEGVTRNTVGSFGLFSTFNSLSGTVGKFGYYTYYNYKQGDGFRPNSEFDSHNYYGHIDYSPTEKTKISFEFTYLDYLAQQGGGLWDEKFQDDPKFSSRERNWFSVNWKLYSAKLEHKFSSKTDFSLTLFGLNAERNAVGFRGIPGEDGINRSPVQEPDWLNEDGEYEYPRDLIKGEFNNWGAEARLLTRYELAGKSSVFLIGSKYYQAKNKAIQGPGSYSKEADFDIDLLNSPNYPNQSNYEFPNLNVSVFGENILNITETLSITPGFRFEYIDTKSNGWYLRSIQNQDIGEKVFESESLPRSFVLFGLGISNQFSNSIELYANVSQNYRSVTFSDIRTTSPAFSVSENISDEKGISADIGLRGKYQDNISYELNGFVILYNDRIGIITTSQENRIQADGKSVVQLRTNIGDALITGAEFFADWNIGETIGLNNTKYRFSTFVNLAITGSEYINAIKGNESVEGKRVEFIPTVNLKTGLNGGYKNFKSSVQLTYLTEQFTDATNSPVLRSGDASSGLKGAIPSYYVMDLSLSYTYKFLKLESGVNNLTDNSYFTRRATGYPGPGIIPSDGRGYYLTLQAKF